MTYGDGFYGGSAFSLDMPAPPIGFGAHTYGGDLFGTTSGPFGNDQPGTVDYFLLAEDYALKQALTGLLVSDENNPARVVGCRFSQPDPEIASQNYPYITIDLIDVVENRAQVHTTYGPLDDGSADYFPFLPPYDPQYYTIGEYFLSPMLLTYQVSTWARHPRHDRMLLSQLNHSVLHPRFAQLTVPADNTVRRLVVTGFTKRDTTDEHRKRLYRNIWTIQIPSEIFYEPVDLTARAQAVIINDETLPQNPPPTLVEPVLYPAQT